MNTTTYRIIWVIGYLILAPFIGGLLEGFDRKISARMQRRIGPPILQPFYDVQKLLNKQTIAVRKTQGSFLYAYLLLMVLTGCMFFGGADLLMCFFVLSTAATFLFFAASVTNSPYSAIGAQRELIQMMTYEPAVLMTAVGFYLIQSTFDVDQLVRARSSAIFRLPGFFIAFVFILTIKMRKSPFDEAGSHHPHQELVKGITSDMGARNLAIYTITEWYENVFLLGVVGLFIVNKNPLSFLAALIVIALVFFLEILIDNTSARVRWETMLKMTWIVTLLTAGINLMMLMLIYR